MTKLNYYLVINGSMKMMSKSTIRNLKLRLKLKIKNNSEKEAQRKEFERQAILAT